MNVGDPYEALGVSRTASQDQIKDAYRGLAKKLHPDLNPGKKDSEQRFKVISEAYEKIGTPEARARFDQGQSQANQSRTGPFYYETQEEPDARYRAHAFGGGLDEDLLRDIFGRSAGRIYRINVNFKDAALGAEKEFVLPEGRRIRVRIPPGIRSGTRLSLAGIDGELEVTVDPSPIFRQGNGTNDIELDLPISLPEAIIGGEVRVPTLEGAALLRLPPGVNTGTRMRLRGKGPVDRGTGRRGDEIVILNIILPEPEDPGLPALKEAIRKWSESHRYDPRKEARWKPNAA